MPGEGRLDHQPLRSRPGSGRSGCRASARPAAVRRAPRRRGPRLSTRSGGQHVGRDPAALVQHHHVADDVQQLAHVARPGQRAGTAPAPAAPARRSRGPPRRQSGPGRPRRSRSRPRRGRAAAACGSARRRAGSTGPRGTGRGRTASSGSRLVAQTMRTFTLRGRVAPTGCTVEVCRKRSSLVCSAEAISQISSRNSVPPSAAAAAPGLSEIAPVKTALHVAEHLGFQQVRRDRAAVQRDERARGAGGPVMDRQGAQLLAGAAFAGDEDRGHRRGDRADLGVDHLHRLGRTKEQPPGRLRPGGGPGIHRVTGAEQQRMRGNSTPRIPALQPRFQP